MNIPVFIFSDGEEKTIKELKKNYEKVFGTTDIVSADNITILDGTDFEGYLLDQGFQELIEQTIHKVAGKGAIDCWINKRSGTQSKPMRSDKPPCETCGQSIYESKLRDYDGEGRKQAILEILDSKKTLYAKAITENLVKLNKADFPTKFVDLFNQIEPGV